MPSVRNIKAIIVLALVASAGTGHLFAQAQSLLSSNQVVITRVENVNPNAILISGINFDKFKAAPVVSLSGVGTTVTAIPSVFNAQARDITATIPANVASIPGSYRLMVSFGSGTAGTDVFEFTVGAIGPNGEKGEKGDKGEVGARGEKGDTGPQGPKGDKGDKGDTGAQGPQGVQGEKGDTGLLGLRGDKGDTGAQGLRGEKGDTGIQGLKGEKGEQGLPGAGGPAGKSSSFPLFHTEPEARAALQVGDVWVQDTSGQVFQIVR